MKYFGVPRCPYCKKRVNFIRTWSLKRQGEYQCPRCGGISNIYLSPLIYVFALLAVFSSGALYFFHKFVLDDVQLSTILQVAVPFIFFFLLSLFLVYLEKPVIKKVSRAEQGKKRGRVLEDRREGGYAAPRNTDNRMFYDEDEYLPQGDYRTGPIPQEMLPKPAPRNDLSKTSVVDVSHPLRAAAKAEPMPEKLGAVKTEPARPQPRQQAARTAKPSGQSFSQVPEPVRQTAPVRQSAPKKPAAPVREAAPVKETAPAQAAVSAPAAQSTVRHVVTQVEIPSVTVSGGDDFLAKYDDPEYVERRLREIREKGGKQ